MLFSETEALEVQVRRQLEVLFMFAHILIKSEMKVKWLGRRGDSQLPVDMRRNCH